VSAALKDFDELTKPLEILDRRVFISSNQTYNPNLMRTSKALERIQESYATAVQGRQWKRM